MGNVTKLHCNFYNDPWVQGEVTLTADIIPQFEIVLLRCFNE